MHNSLISKIHQWRVSISNNLLHWGLISGGFLVVLSVVGCPENIVGGILKCTAFLLSSNGEEKTTVYPVRNGGRTSMMISFCNSWEFESQISGSLLRPLMGSYKSSMLVEQKSLERLRVSSWGFQQASMRQGHRCRVPANEPYLLTYKNLIARLCNFLVYFFNMLPG